jgi:hypothetical protein
LNGVIFRKRPYINFEKAESGAGHIQMGRLIKYLFILLVILAIGVVGYAYVGPWFGADFSPPQEEIRVPLVLDAT